jgi:hypothetical protein
MFDLVKTAAHGNPCIHSLVPASARVYGFVVSFFLAERGSA